MKKITEANVKGKRVLVRACFDVPTKNGRVADDTRIKAALPTINWLIENGASVVIISKMGRPEGKVVKELSLFQVVPTLSGLLNKRVSFVSESVGPEVEAMTERMQPGDILVLENLRFHKEEEENDPTFAKSLAGLADLFVFDDFPNVKNDHAGTTGVTKYLPSYAGINFAEEIENLKEAFEKPARPFVAVIGGAKVSTKIDVLKALVKKIDVLILGGGMANTFIAAEGYDVGSSLYEEDFLDEAEEIKKLAEDAGVELMLPDDVRVATKLKDSAKVKERSLDEIKKSEIIVDIGPKSVAKFSEPLKFAGTIFWNGPIGIAEHKNFGKGNESVAKIISESRAKTIIGGGDTVALIPDVHFDFVSNGGGATLEFLAGEELPALKALE